MTRLQREMTDQEVVAHLRQWVQHPPASPFAWPTDGCGYHQHVRYAKHRNAHYDWLCTQSWEVFLNFVSEYADKLERGEVAVFAE